MENAMPFLVLLKVIVVSARGVYTCYQRIRFPIIFMRSNKCNANSLKKRIKSAVIPKFTENNVHFYFVITN